MLLILGYKSNYKIKIFFFLLFVIGFFAFSNVNSVSACVCNPITSSPSDYCRSVFPTVGCTPKHVCDSSNKCVGAGTLIPYSDIVEKLL